MCWLEGQEGITPRRMDATDFGTQMYGEGGRPVRRGLGTGAQE
jgi:hypothetical protein